MSNNHRSQALDAQKGGALQWIKTHREQVTLWARLGIAGVLMTLVGALVWHDRDQLSTVNWDWIPLAWSLMLVSTGVKAYRWSLLVRLSRMDLGFKRLFGTYLIGSFFSTVLPSSVGGDALRAVDTASHTGKVADSTSSVLIERGMGLLAIAGAGSGFALFMEPGKVPLPFLIMVHGMFVGGVVGLVMLWQGWFIDPIFDLVARLKMEGLTVKARSLQRALREHVGHPAILLQMFGLSLIANALTMGATYIVLMAVTDPIPLAAFVPMMALATTAELIPISPASLGVKEGAYVFFLGLVGVGSAEAGVIAIIMRVLTWAHALLGGAVFIQRTMARRPAEGRVTASTRG